MFLSLSLLHFFNVAFADQLRANACLNQFSQPPNGCNGGPDFCSVFLADTLQPNTCQQFVQTNTENVRSLHAFILNMLSFL